MRKHLLSFCALTLAYGAHAQSLSLSDVDRAVWGSVESGTIITSEAVVTNNSGNPIDVRVESEDLTVLANTLNYFCWGQCYEPGITLSPNTITLQPGQSLGDMFYGDYKPMGVPGTSTVKYCFYDNNNRPDSVCYIATFTAYAVGIEDNPLLTRGMGDPYPNPAVNVANIKYAFSSLQGARMEVYDVLGQRVRSISIDQAQGALKLDVSGLRPGVYLLQMVNNGKTVATRRLNVVR
jgi:hypothetical protein